MMTKELTVINQEGKLALDSRDVAEMIGKRHDHLIRDIKVYVKVLEENPKLGTPNFFIESTYKSSQNKDLLCYLLTKKGCDMVANKMTGEKGILFTATYVTKFEEMENALSQPKLPTTYKEALQSLLIEVEKNEKLELENKELNKEIEYKEDIIVNLVDTVSLSEKRQILNRVVRMGGGSKVRERWLNYINNSNTSIILM